MNFREVRYHTPALPKIDQQMLRPVAVGVTALLPMLLTACDTPPSSLPPEPTPIVGLLEEGVAVPFSRGLIVNKVPGLKTNIDIGKLDDELLKHPTIARRLSSRDESTHVFFIMPPAFALDDSPDKVNPFIKKYLKSVNLNGKRPLLKDLPIYELIRYLSVTLTNFKNSDARELAFREALDKEMTVWLIRAMQTTDDHKTGFGYPSLPYEMVELIKKKPVFTTKHIPEVVLIAAGLPLKPNVEKTTTPLLRHR